jgi:hypothetical protein
MFTYNEVSNLYGSAFKAEIDTIIWQMTHFSQLRPIREYDMGYLYNETMIVKRCLYSETDDVSRRMNDILRAILKHEPTDKMDYEHLLILIQASSEHPLLIKELESLDNVTRRLSPRIEVRWGLGQNEDLGKKLFAMIVYSK